MRRLAFFAPLGAVVALAASPALAQAPTINVALGSDLQAKVEELGERDVSEQTTRLMEVVQSTLARRGALDGATIDLIVTDLKPNRPTFQQQVERPGLDGIRSLSIGGATIEGTITTADGQVQPVKYDWYSSNIAEVRGFGVWQDADRAYRRLAANLADGRYVTR
ncbi:hypothetical protein [Brevundimonas sp.]|uniref:hypothetical protein n=1 Tax=Brevundimonas sp. TaxID=1871086 RepID=UPI0035AE721B